MLRTKELRSPLYRPVFELPSAVFIIFSGGTLLLRWYGHWHGTQQIELEFWPRSFVHVLYELAANTMEVERGGNFMSHALVCSQLDCVDSLFSLQSLPGLPRRPRPDPSPMLHLSHQA